MKNLCTCSYRPQPRDDRGEKGSLHRDHEPGCGQRRPEQADGSVGVAHRIAGVEGAAGRRKMSEWGGGV